MSETFALVGSRRLSRNNSKLLFTIGFLLASAGHKGTSGGAPGADTSFEEGMLFYANLKQKDPSLPGNLHPDFLSVYLPSFRFSNRKADGGIYINASKLPVHKDALLLAEQFHGGWQYLPDFARLLMARNGNQVLGDDLLSPVSRVICWTPDGAMKETTRDTGGTGQAIRIAVDRGIPVHNLGNPDIRARYEQRIETMKSVFANWVDLDAIYDTAVHETGANVINQSNLLSNENLANIDAIIHGANCAHTMGAGFARQLVKKFPQALEADLATPKSPRKLGTYSSVTVEHKGKPLTIINAYTQKAPANKAQQRSGELVADYDAIRKVMKAIAKDHPNKKFGMPMIGAGLANGCWLTIRNLIGESIPTQSIQVFDISRMERNITLNHDSTNQIKLL